MYTNYFVSTEAATIIVSVMSLLWFLVGIAVGSKLDRRSYSGCNGGGREQRGRRQHGRHRSGGSSGGGGGGTPGSIEIYVGNLSYDVTENDLLKSFSAYGRVDSARVIQNRFNGKSKGFAFVEMSDRPQAEAAIRALDGADMKGRRIVVNEARSKAHD